MNHVAIIRKQGSMANHNIDTNFSLTNKVAMITGGAAGIGRAIADLFGQKGAKLVLVDKSDSVDAVANEFTANGVESLGIVTDITVRENIEQFVEEATSALALLIYLSTTRGLSCWRPLRSLVTRHGTLRWPSI